MKGTLRSVGSLSVALLIALLSHEQARAASSLLIWPINPRIEAGHKAAALWLENRGRQPVSLQVRVLAWRQERLADRLDPQQQVVGSPPVVTIAPGKRQMVRLISLQPALPGSEQAYRVLVDEMLQPESAASTHLGVNFQMRYSVPLFVLGAGAAPDEGASSARGELSQLRPQLGYRLVRFEGRRYLRLHNQGTAHARLAGVRLELGGRQLSLADGLLGYVLPGAWMQWPLPDTLASDAFTLEALVNERREPLVIPAL